MTDLNSDFFSRHGTLIQPHLIARHPAIPFTDHPQFPYLKDIIARKSKNHAILQAGFSSTFYPHFVNALALQLSHQEMIYLDLHSLTNNVLAELENQPQASKMPRVIAIANATLEFIERCLLPLVNTSQDRFLLFIRTEQKREFNSLKSDFNFVELSAPTDKDKLSVLKERRTELEEYHHAIIPDQLLIESYQLAERFLSADHALDKALQILDSAAARVATRESKSNSGANKPTVSSDVVTNVLATWTEIPASNLQLNKFKLSEFNQGMRQMIFGQDVALTIFGHALQQAHARLRQNLGPFCSFLLAGPEHSGKKSAALALAEQLFKQSSILYFAQPFSHDLKSIMDIKLQRCHDKHYATLKDVIREIPYAVIFFNHVDLASPTVVDNLHQMFATGHLHDEDGNDYNFRQSIIILGTTLGAEYLSDITRLFDASDSDEPVDLMHLIMHEQRQTSSDQELRYSPQELVDGLMPILTPFLPESISQHLHVVPFLPLDKPAIEKIIHLKLRVLDRQLELRHGIELTYAHEVVRHLAREVIGKQDLDESPVDIDKTLRQLYFVIEHAIFSQAENPDRPSQLILQLNETGQLLRCDWLASARAHQSAG